MSGPRPLLLVDELAERMKVSPEWVYVEARRGRIPCVRIRGMVRFDPDEIDQYIAQHTVEAVA